MAWACPRGASSGSSASVRRPDGSRRGWRPLLGDEAAAELARGDALRPARHLGFPGRDRARRPQASWSSPPAMPAPGSTSASPPPIALQPQVEGDLGRQDGGHSSRASSRTAPSRVVLIGSDAPTLDPLVHPRRVPRARRARRRRSGRPTTAAITSSVAARRAADLRRDRVEHAARPRPDDRPPRRHWRSLAVLPPWYDVDTPESWRMLRGHLRAMRHSGLDPGSRRLESLIGI